MFTKPTHSRPGRFRLSGGLALCIIGGGAALAFATMSAVPSSRPLPVRQMEPSPFSVDGVLTLISLDPLSLAVAGVSAQNATAVRNFVSERLTAESAALRTLLDQRNVARGRAERPPLPGADGTTPSAAQLRAAATQSQSGVAAWLAALRSDAIAELPEEQRASLNRVYANRDSALPHEFRDAVYEQGELVKLRDALSQRVRAAQLGEPVGAAEASTISAYETVAVLAARLRVETARGQSQP
ncbi:MAG TPA: hypothetical protein VFF65_12380 [Phycisphaerales bacterium]|nr:hypothetical protein [Phycisphaerales bacterium]